MEIYFIINDRLNFIFYTKISRCRYICFIYKKKKENRYDNNNTTFRNNNSTEPCSKDF